MYNVQVAQINSKELSKSLGWSAITSHTHYCYTHKGPGVHTRVHVHCINLFIMMRCMCQVVNINKHNPIAKESLKPKAPCTHLHTCTFVYSIGP